MDKPIFRKGFLQKQRLNSNWISFLMPTTTRTQSGTKNGPFETLN